MTKTYLSIVFLIGILVIIYGIVCPFLISMANTEAVILGIVLIIITPLILGSVVIKMFTTKTEGKKK